MPLINIGTAGWEYKDWNGTFYPKFLERENHLKLYAEIFEIVEVNSTFYRLPNIETVKNWNEKVPENFRFIIKMWQEITHNITEEGLDNKISTFFSRMEPLSEKIYGYLIQFPPWFKYSNNNIDILNELIRIMPRKNIYFFEFRDNSWFKKKIIDEIINRENISLVTTYLQEIRPYYYPNQSYYYIRLIGDRSINKFNIVERTQKKTIQDMNSTIQKIIDTSDVKEIFIIVNNHFTGFAPKTANELKKKWNLPIRAFSTQKTLSDFL